jgi:hypothetical protein
MRTTHEDSLNFDARSCIINDMGNGPLLAFAPMVSNHPTASVFAGVSVSIALFTPTRTRNPSRFTSMRYLHA